jgi:large subunit ribosomal protein L15
MIDLSNLSPAPGSRKQRKRLGRGQGTGHGKTAGRGHKGFKARSGSGVKPGFEGGQMPLHRRLPKRGFHNIYKKVVGVVNVSDLDRFDDGTKIDRDLLTENGLIPQKSEFIKILGNGEVSKKFILSVDKVSGAARQKIEAAGGSIED